MKDLFLGLFKTCLHLQFWRLERVHEATGEWAEQNGGGERAQITRLPGGPGILHNTYTSICRPTGTPDLERGIHFRDVS